MECTNCKKNFPEKDIELSHDVPCYLFWEEKDRKKRKQKADKFNRRWLCSSCHKLYEEELKRNLINFSVKFSKKYFKEE